MGQTSLPSSVLAGYVAAILFEILMPLAVGLFIRRRLGVPWRFFWYGALVFLLSQILTRIPAIQVVQFAAGRAIAASQSLQLAWLVILAVTAGLFEETGRYLGYRYLVKDARSWRVGLMFGAGHGGLESMLLTAGLVALGMVNIVALLSLTPQQVSALPSAQQAQVQAALQQINALTWYTPLVGAYERITAMAIQISLSILVLQVWLRGSSLWYWLALAYHAFIDLVAVLAGRAYGIPGAELAATIFGLIGLWLIFHFRNEPLSHEVEPADAAQ